MTEAELIARIENMSEEQVDTALLDMLKPDHEEDVVFSPTLVESLENSLPVGYTTDKTDLVSDTSARSASSTASSQQLESQMSDISTVVPVVAQFMAELDTRDSQSAAVSCPKEDGSIIADCPEANDSQEDRQRRKKGNKRKHNGSGGKKGDQDGDGKKPKKKKRKRDDIITSPNEQASELTSLSTRGSVPSPIGDEHDKHELGTPHRKRKRSGSVHSYSSATDAGQSKGPIEEENQQKRIKQVTPIRPRANHSPADRTIPFDSHVGNPIAMNGATRKEPEIPSSPSRRNRDLNNDAQWEVQETPEPEEPPSSNPMTYLTNSIRNRLERYEQEFQQHEHNQEGNERSTRRTSPPKLPSGRTDQVESSRANMGQTHRPLATTSQTSPASMIPHGSPKRNAALEQNVTPQKHARGPTPEIHVTPRGTGASPASTSTPPAFSPAQHGLLPPSSPYVGPDLSKALPPVSAGNLASYRVPVPGDSQDYPLDDIDEESDGPLQRRPPIRRRLTPTGDTGATNRPSSNSRRVAAPNVGNDVVPKNNDAPPGSPPHTSRKRDTKGRRGPTKTTPVPPAETATATAVSPIAQVAPVTNVKHLTRGVVRRISVMQPATDQADEFPPGTQPPPLPSLEEIYQTVGFPSSLVKWNKNVKIMAAAIKHRYNTMCQKGEYYRIDWRNVGLKALQESTAPPQPVDSAPGAPTQATKGKKKPKQRGINPTSAQPKAGARPSRTNTAASGTSNKRNRKASHQNRPHHDETPPPELPPPQPTSDFITVQYPT
ncbi:hypothetical protein BJ508DRAFT_330805 [Ascobolus immersus RN42]|uniref:Uncharacterized protein n=1 Tax=Ascobolus immersus RN42 TaxID=1160509 RepID=A0A3N4I4G5_ASCIM|nr:hypothetical protein BJ508DRAFT_330805 [Ascobolus immersus RN42]